MSATTIGEWASILWRLLRRKEQRFDLARRIQGANIDVHHEVARPSKLDGEDRPPVTDLHFVVSPRALSVHQNTRDDEDDQ